MSCQSFVINLWRKASILSVSEKDVCLPRDNCGEVVCGHIFSEEMLIKIKDTLAPLISENDTKQIAVQSQCILFYNALNLTYLFVTIKT